MTDPKPMDPEHRRRVWAFIRDDPDYDWAEDWDGRDETEASLRVAMSSSDYWEVEAKRTESIRVKVATVLLQQADRAGLAEETAKLWRERCARTPVTAKDVDAAGITGERLIAWLIASGEWHELEWSREHVRLFQFGDTFDQIQVGEGPANTWVDASRVKADAIVKLAGIRGCPAFDILDEMAAVVTG